MPFDLELLLTRKRAGWKVKIYDFERLEPPHVTILYKTRAWRLSLRDGAFLDRGIKWSQIDKGVRAAIEAAWEVLRQQWDQMHPTTPFRAKTMSKTTTRPTRSRRPSTVRYVLVGLDRAFRDNFGRSHTLWCADNASIRSAIQQASSDWTWICGESENAENLLGQMSVFQAQHHGSRTRFGDLLMLESPRARIIPSLHGCFGNVIGEAPSFTTLPLDQLADVLNSDNKANLFIGGVVDERTKTLALVRGNFERLTVPLSFFKPSGTAKPDFRKFSIDDCGQTISFGSYEASADAILYELDSEYRRTIHAQRRANEKSFGASLRRLLIQRGLARDAFSGVSSKTIARIERSEVDKPQGRTLSIIAKTLKVSPDEIESF